MAKNDWPTVSVIVPVYNTAKHLATCINSILHQTFTGFELLLIDDGSTDNSAKICVQFAEKDARIRVFQQTNSGVSSARNVGLNNATGEYICFVDSDDWIEDNYLMTFILNIEKDNSLIIQNYLWNNKKKWNLNTVSFVKPDFNKLFSHLDIVRKGVICAKLFSADILKANSIAFKPEVKYGEDCIFMLEYLKHVDLVKYIDYAGYHYMQHNPGSLSKTHNSFKSEFETFELLRFQLDCLIKSFSLSKTVQADINNWLGVFFLRSIQSFYRGKDKRTLKDRLRFYKQAYRSDHIKVLSGLTRADVTFLNLISVHLFKRRLFYLFDFYMQFLVILKNNLDGYRLFGSWFKILV